MLKKKILVDVTTIGIPTDGLSLYILNFLAYLPSEAFELFYISLLVNKNVQRKELLELMASGRFEVIEADVSPIGPKRDLDMLRFMKTYRGVFDVFHSPSNQYPMCVKNGIATIHDISFKYYLDKPWWTFHAARRYLNLVIKVALKRAGTVIAVSHFTKNLVIKEYKNYISFPDKIKVAHEGWEHLQREEPQPAEGFINPYGRYLFYVGTSRKHKNMKGLLRGFRIATESLPADVMLVISGNQSFIDRETSEIIIKINEKEQRVFFTGYISAERLKALFSNCDGFIFPSLAEGFGIPVLECFYFGKPLLCSNTASLPEIAGDAALYFDPFQPKDIARAINEFYHDPALQSVLAEKGKQRLTQFSWKKMSAEILEIYKEHFKKYPAVT